MSKFQFYKYYKVDYLENPIFYYAVNYKENVCVSLCKDDSQFLKWTIRDIDFDEVHIIHINHFEITKNKFLEAYNEALEYYKQVKP